LKAGEQVVTDGQTRLTGGAKVEVRAPGGQGGERAREGGALPRGEGGRGRGDKSKDGAGSPAGEVPVKPAPSEAPAQNTPRRSS
jgi:hypothetical protein